MNAIMYSLIAISTRVRVTMYQVEHVVVLALKTKHLIINKNRLQYFNK